MVVSGNHRSPSLTRDKPQYITGILQRGGRRGREREGEGGKGREGKRGEKERGEGEREGEGERKGRRRREGGKRERGRGEEERENRGRGRERGEEGSTRKKNEWYTSETDNKGNNSIAIVKATSTHTCKLYSTCTYIVCTHTRHT